MMFVLKLAIILLKFLVASTNQDAGCTITEFSQVSEVVSRCTDIVISNLIVPGGVGLNLNLHKGSTVTFEGTTKFEVGYWEGPLVQIGGENVLVQGAPGSILNAQGEKYWDGHGGSGGVTKPRFFTIHAATGGSVFKNIYLLNCAHFCVGINKVTDLHITDFTIDVAAGHKNGKNTDGFGISSGHNILIENSVVMNQDDCVVVNSGTNMVFRNISCSGSHGLSFSVGSSDSNDHNALVQNITFSDSTVSNGVIGIHLKTKRGTGLVTDVTYENIKFSGITRDGIYINQDYGDEGNTKRQIQISNLKMSNIHGTVKGHKAKPVYIVCNDNACSNWNWSNIDISGGGKNSCNYHPNGFSC